MGLDVLPETALLHASHGEAPFPAKIEHFKRYGLLPESQGLDCLMCAMFARPESGPDCLICGCFARKRARMGLDVLPETALLHASHGEAPYREYGTYKTVKRI